MYEQRSQKLLSTEKFLRRMTAHGGVAAIVVVLSLAIGTGGYHVLGDLPWVDAFLNASMILGGMGPVDPMKTTPAKLFAAFYALYSGVILLTTAAILVAPVLHRFLHHFHLERKTKDT